MKRREFTLAGAAGTASVLGLAGISLPAGAQQPAAVNSSEYRVLQKPVATDVPKGKAEVIEFFGYWCPHCNQFEPEFEAWRKSAPAAIVVHRVPVAFRPNMAPLQRMFYALESLGLVSAVHGQVYAAIHKQRINLMSDDAILQWAASHPLLKGDRFVQAYKAFGMDAKLRRADQLARDFGIEGVPSLGVAGKFYIDGETARGMSRALQVATQLALQQAKA